MKGALPPAPQGLSIWLMGWLQDHRERVKDRLRKIIDWRQTWSDPPYLHTVLDEWKIVVRPKDSENINSCNAVAVAIQTIDGDDEDFYECARYEVLGR